MVRLDLSSTALTLPWLVRLRWHAVAGQTLAILVVAYGLGVGLLVPALLGVTLLLAISNAVLARVIPRIVDPPAALLGAILVFDAIELSLQIGLAGGTDNPFAALYLVEILVAVLVLDARWIAAVSLASIAGFSTTYFVHVPIAGLSARTEVLGRWAALVLTVAMTGYLGWRVAGTLRRQATTLARAQRLAERAERLASLTTLAAGAAHELGTPLGTIAIASNELEALIDASPAEAREEARVIRDEVDRCREIVERMSARAGKAIGELPGEINAAAVLAIVLHHLPVADRARVITFGDLDAVVCCPLENLAQALGGLVTNALHASAPGLGITIEVRREDDVARFIVNDRGTGIPRALQARLGEPFFTTKPPGKGMGLGLFLAQSFAELCSGSLEIDSVENEGTRVCLTMPLAIGGAR